ncbi:MAG: hypothetical protein FWD73_14640 [Polyangiaceae bacterium]|nr:hypothetical protein [Polyangiaceae bacterium]
MRSSSLPPIDVEFTPPPGPPGKPSAIAIPKGIGSPKMPNIQPNVKVAPAATRDPTTQLASLKARLEADKRPRYVVIKDRMDHGPFTAVEVLQQIASHAFVGGDGLRDEITGEWQSIDEWESFAPFAEHARMHREITQEKKEVAKIEIAEKKAGIAKYVIGGVLTVALLVPSVMFIAKKVGEKKDSGDRTGDPLAIDMSDGGSLTGGAKKPGTKGVGGGGGGAAGAYVSGGSSYEAALASNNQEIAIGAGKAMPDLTDAQLSAPMSNSAFLAGCGAPEGMRVVVKVAVKNGHAVGVSVYPNPPNGAVATCVDRHVRGLSWPFHSSMFSFTTTYGTK